MSTTSKVDLGDATLCVAYNQFAAVANPRLQIKMLNLNKNSKTHKLLAKIKLNVLDRSGFYWTRSKILHRYKVRCSEPLVLKDFGLYSQQVDLGGKYYSCNPSIVADGNSYVATVRTVNYRLVRNGWFIVEGQSHDTRNFIVKLNDRFEIMEKAMVDDVHEREASADAINGFEDLRIFFWKSELWALGNACNFELQKNVMALQRINDGRVVENYYIRSPFSSAREKNWMPFVREDRLYAVYSLNPLVVLEIDKSGSKVKLERDLNLGCDLYGSSQLVRWKSGWICVVHDRIDVKRAGRLYRHRFLYINDDWSVTLSAPFCWKIYGVEFCCGLAFQGGKFAASISVHDRQAFFVEMDEHVVESILCGNLRKRL
ncbi:hypothetical protein [Paraburkholderia dioscoreae]|nr:hypothetical protein [Paraburkholderia dioscoreae]